MSSRASEHLRELQLQYARRARVFGNSPWAEPGAALAGKDDAIYFGNGAPAPEAQPLERLAWASELAWRDASDALGYGEVEGYLPLKELICERMRLRGICVTPDEVMITSGSQQGIDLLARLMLDPGDSMIVEGPTYIGAMQALDVYEPNYLVMHLDEGGPDVDWLRQELDRRKDKPKLAYLVPTFQNPTGYSYSPVRRQALHDLLIEHDILILEDDPYGELYFDQPPEPAMRARDNQVIYLGTFSKTICPGIRVGWLVAPPKMMELLIMAKEGADIHSDRVMMRTVYLASQGFLDDHVAGLRSFYTARRDAMLEALQEQMPPDVRWSRPGGGFFLWMDLPKGASSNQLLKIASQHDVAYLPGNLFYPAGTSSSGSFRLGFSVLPEYRLREGVRRLSAAINEYLATLD